MKKFLFIDDDQQWLASLRRVFRKKDNVFFAECHSVQEALEAVATHQPDILFLDHSLTEGGDEGLDVVKELQGSGIIIYSTTAYTHLADVYAKYGVEVVGKMNLVRIKEIITG